MISTQLREPSPELIAKFVLVPGAAICIPLVTGLYGHLNLPVAGKLLVIAVPCMLLSWIIWEVNVRMMKHLRNKWYRKDKNVHLDFARRVVLHAAFTFIFSSVTL